jgi:hypothetical protein
MLSLFHQLQQQMLRLQQQVLRPLRRRPQAHQPPLRRRSHLPTTRRRPSTKTASVGK